MKLLKTIGWFLIFKIWEIFILLPLHTLVIIGKFVIAVGKALYEYWIIPVTYSVSFYAIYKAAGPNFAIIDLIIICGLTSVISTFVFCAILHTVLFNNVATYRDLADVGETLKQFIADNWEKAQKKAEGKK